MPRNSLGVYTLPTGNPVISGSTIASTWANNTMGDLGSEMTNSLDRSGRGGMLAALLNIDGTVTAPAFGFTNEPTTGMWRNGTGKISFSVLGVDTFDFTALGMGFPLGTAPLPSIYFVGDTNTGMWSPAADTIAWSTGGVERFRADSLGGFNIGSATAVTPSSALNKVLTVGSPTGGVSVMELSVNNVSTGHMLGTGNEMRFNTVAPTIPMTFFLNNSEKMRLDSTSGGLYIGRSVGGFSSVRLWVNQATNKNIGFYYNGGDPTLATFDDVGAFIKQRIAGAGVGISGDGNTTQSVLIDTKNNVGVGRIASALWGTAPFHVVEIGAGSGSSTIYGQDNLSAMYISTNVYYDGSAYRYTSAAGGATNYRAYNDGAGSGFLWQVAPTGAANAVCTFLDAVILDNVGRVSLQLGHNNAAGLAGTTLPYIGSGTFTPGVLNVANTSALSGNVCRYMRVANVVTYSGTINFTITANTTTTTVDFSLPIASTGAVSGFLNPGNPVAQGPTCNVTAAGGNARASFLSSGTAAGGTAVATFHLTYLVA